MSTVCHVMILGCGRSGTSIFGELFDHLPPYTYYSEPPFEELISRDFTRPIAVKVPRESKSFLPDPGLSFPLSTLLEFMPAPRRFFWQIRHPLDTICSLKVGISRNWGHHPRPPDWQEWLERPLLERCAYHWNYINTVGYAPVAHLAELCRFEDMIDNPLGFASKVTKTAGLDLPPWEGSLQGWATRVQNENTPDFVEAETSRAYTTQDHRVKVGRWQENLSPKEIAQVLPLIRDTAQQFGYDLSGA